MQIEQIKTNELDDYTNNPRHNDDAVEYVANSIKEFGFKNPILIDEDNVIIAGHTRKKAAMQLGLKTVPVIRVKDLTDDQIKAFRIADNKVAEFSTWDINLLNTEIEMIELDMDQFGINDIDVDMFTGLEDDEDETEAEAEAEEDDFDTEPPKEPTAKRGDIYQLGNHRLLCGDSTNEDDVKKLMNGRKAELVFTDPPYGMMKEKDGVLNDNLKNDAFIDFNKQWIALSLLYATDNASWYCWGSDESIMDIYSKIIKPRINAGELYFRNVITWAKGNGIGMSSELMRCYAEESEKCLFVMKGQKEFDDNSYNYPEVYEPIRKYLVQEADKVGIKGVKDLEAITGTQMYSHWFTKSQWTLIPKKYYQTLQAHANGKAFTKPYKELSKQYEEAKYSDDNPEFAFKKNRGYFNNTHDNMTDVWRFQRTSIKEREDTGEHATPKPIELCARGIKSSSRQNGNVLDLFGGSGSTLIACEQLQRNCYMIELDPRYVDVIIERWEKLTGQKAIKEEI